MQSTGVTIAGVPALIRSGGPAEAAAERGTVLYYHGFSRSKQRCEPYLTALAKAGFLAVSLKLIDDTAAEVPSVLDDLAARGWARPGRVGICGRSLGGNISYAAVLADRRLRAAVSVVGSPEWTLPRAHSPHRHPDRFFPVAILSQNAEHDEYVPAGPVRDFHARLQPWYAREPGRLEYVEYAGAGHFLTPELNADSGRRLVAWFERWLLAGQ